VARLVGVDVGGTFTDVVVHSDGYLRGFKVPSTPADPAQAVRAAVDWNEDDTFLHGTTVATNALLEGRGARVALVTDEGFEDLVEIARQDRPSLYDPAVDRPEPLVPREMRFGLSDGFDSAAAGIRDAAPELAVVGLIDSYADPDRELDLARIIGSLASLPVIAATSVSPEFREYERIATALLSAYLTPVTSGYLRDLEAALPVSRCLVMTSAGGLLPFDEGADQAVRLVLSGPAGGVVAAAAVGAHHGHDEVISFDMGGTSTDVCRVAGGVPAAGSGHRVAGRVARVPSVPVRTIGAGGGSIGWVDPGGALRVGPRSAGADPGPVAYRAGGTEPTVTDANLVAGRLPSDLALAGSLRLDAGVAREAISELGTRIGLSADECARGMLEVVDSHMEHALRAVSIEEGADPREAVLVAFGGAGGLHAGRLARRLGVPTILIPPLSGVFSALGLLLAPPRVDAARTVMLSADDSRLMGLVDDMGREAGDRYSAVFSGLPEQVEVGFDCRYEGQSHELEVASAPDWSAIRQAFEASHQRHFGFIRKGEPIEVVTIRSVAVGRPPLEWADVAGAPRDIEPVGRDGVWERATLPAGFDLAGPAAVVEESSAVVVESGQRLAVLDDGSLEITEA
jgi:N-methylhydantoinase A